VCDSLAWAAMSLGADAFEPIDSLAPWGRLLSRHRTAWTEELLEGWSVVDLAAATDPVAALAEAPDRTAFVWLEGYAEAESGDRLRAKLEEAGRRNAPIVVGFETDSEGRGSRAAEALLETLDGADVVAQELAAGSLIGPVDGSDPAVARQRSVHTFVCANLEPAMLSRSTAEVGAAAEPLMTGYVSWLEQAHRELRAANARLGRERLGTHDAAAAAVETRRAALEKRVAELEEQLEIWRTAAETNHERLVVTLQAPRYRAVDRLRELAFMLPGVSLLLRLRSRRLGER
jgi:hypothetical protein